MKTIYLVRHGESEGNVGKVLQGADATLTDKGREQARVVAKRCASLPVDTLISSTMVRARETAAAIAEATGLTVEESGLFVERGRPSSVVGKSPLDPTALLTDAAWNLSTFDEGPKVEDGECFSELKQRANRALHFLAEHPSDSILVVTHGVFIRQLFASIIFGAEQTGADFKKFYFAVGTDNTGISVITIDPKAPKPQWIIAVLNDRSHLGD